MLYHQLSIINRYSVLGNVTNGSKLNVPNNAIDSIANCPYVLFPNIKLILTIISTLPISVASAERSFSTL